MKVLLKGAAVAMAMSLAFGASAEAQLTTLSSPLCGAYASFGSVNYFACGGAFAGNNSNQDTEGWILANWGVEMYNGGSTQAGSQTGPMGGFGNTDSGTINFDSPLTGDFVLALKVSNSFSLYYFKGVTDLASLDFSTIGSGLNTGGSAQALSHATLYRVPEPGLLLLLGTGLIGMAVIRRREEIVA